MCLSFDQGDINRKCAEIPENVVSEKAHPSLVASLYGM